MRGRLLTGDSVGPGGFAASDDRERALTLSIGFGKAKASQHDQPEEAAWLGMPLYAQQEAWLTFAIFSVYAEWRPNCSEEEMRDWDCKNLGLVGFRAGFRLQAKSEKDASDLIAFLISSVYTECWNPNATEGRFRA